jgi:hypothetical protein
MIMMRICFRLALSFAVVIVVAVSSSSCRKAEPAAPPMATPTVTLNHDRVPLGSPLDITYKFVVAPDAHFDQDYRVMAHVVDADEEMIWNDDHNPPVPTSQWKPGQVVEYTRTLFVPVYPYVGEATIQIGLYSATTQKRLPLAGETTGQRSYKVARLQLQPQTENLPSSFRDGWQPTEVAERNASIQWQWTKKQATFTFRNPKKDCLLYLDIDNPGSVLKETRRVQLSVNGQTIDAFDLETDKLQLKRVPLTASQLGDADMVDLLISVDKSYIPALVPGANSKDPRELGVRVFHAFVDPR